MARIIASVALAIGSLVLSAGLGIAALSAAEQRFFGVFAGFGLFVAGYKICQFKINDAHDQDISALVGDILEAAGAVELLMVVLGLGAVTYGFTLLFDSMTTVNLPGAVLSSALMFGGYALAHYAVNGTVI